MQKTEMSVLTPKIPALLFEKKCLSRVTAVRKPETL